MRLVNSRIFRNIIAEFGHNGHSKNVDGNWSKILISIRFCPIPIASFFKKDKLKINVRQNIGKVRLLRQS
jgi:hypothetical protein